MMGHSRHTYTASPSPEFLFLRCPLHPYVPNYLPVTKEACGHFLCICRSLCHVQDHFRTEEKRKRRRGGEEEKGRKPFDSSFILVDVQNLRITALTVASSVLGPHTLRQQQHPSSELFTTPKVEWLPSHCHLNPSFCL